MRAAHAAYTRANAAYLASLRRHQHTDPECIRLLDLAGAAYYRWMLELLKLNGVATDPRERWRFPAETTPTETETAR